LFRPRAIDARVDFLRHDHVAEKRIDLRAGRRQRLSEYDTDEDAAIGPESAIGS